MLLTAQLTLAVVAGSEKFRYTQPDGTVITLQLHGDEFHSWTTMDGVTVVRCQDGFYRPESEAALVARRAAAQLSRAELIDKDKIHPAVATTGRKPFVVILVEFSDLSFTVPNANQAFSNLLNQTGYSANGGTGSVHDYYYENSSGKFDPQFDVYGPVKVSNTCAYYGAHTSSANDSHVAEAFNEACKLLDSSVDFSRYDTDGDGYVDNVFFYYAGHNEAEGGGEDTIWPHASSIYTYNCVCDGVRIYRYACSSEYRGSSGSTMCGIGTFCHEYGHVLGLPDFYDTDYAENGSAKTLGAYSLMSNGNYNNSGRTPPYLNIMERNILGWSDGPVEWTEAGTKSVAPIYDNVAYYTPTSTDKEWFVYETRDGSGWDSYVGKGLLIYHLDRSTTHYVGGVSAAQRWNNKSKINAYSEHPCFYVVQAKSSSSNYYTFGGASGVTSFTGTTSPGSVDWDGCVTGYNLTDISFNGKNTVLNLSVSHSKIIKGTVKTDKGVAVSGAQVTVVPQSSFVSAALTSTALGRLQELSVSELENSPDGLTATTNDSGSFLIEIESEDTAFYVVVSKEGYVTQFEEVSLSKGSYTIQFVMPKIFTDEAASLKKHNDNVGSYLGLKNTKSCMGSVLFSASELTGFVGTQIMSVNFSYNGVADAVYVIIDFGSRRVLTQKLENPQGNGALNKVDVSSYNLTIPEGEGVYFGYALQNTSSGYPLTYASNAGVSGGMNYAAFDLTSSWWYSSSGRNILVSADVQSPTKPLTTLGYYLIRNEKGSYAAGDVFTFALEKSDVKYKSISWYFDGQKTESPSVTLSSGKHSVKAVIDNYDGTMEVLFLNLIVE